MNAPVRSSVDAAPLVSVIVPCYNYGRFLPGCVASIFRATSHAVEVVIMDDASTDGTPHIAASLASADGRIRVIRHEHNWGHIATYNHGLGLVQGRYLHLISADDELAPHALDRATAIMERHPEVGLVYGRVARRVAENVPVVRSPRVATYAVVRGADWIAARCRDGRNPILSPEVTLRRSVALSAGDYEPRLPDLADLEMWLRIAARSALALIQDADQAVYRIHGANMNLASSRRTTPVQRYRQRLQAFELFFDKDAALLDKPAELALRVRRRIVSDVVAQARRDFDGTPDARTRLIEALAMAVDAVGDGSGVPGWDRSQRLVRRNRAPRALGVRSFAYRALRWWRWQVDNRDLGHRGVRKAFRGTLSLASSHGEGAAV